MIRVAIGAVLGAVAAMAYASSERFQRQIKGKKKALGEGFRLPLPGTMVDLPTDAQDLTVLDDVVCECAIGMRQNEQALVQNGQLPDPATVSGEVYSEATISFLQQCSAAALYAPEEVPWPPVQGDHSTIHQLWGIIGYRIRRLIVRGELEELCFGPGAHPPPVPPEPPPAAPGGFVPSG